MLDFGGADVEIVRGSQAYSMKANWKLLIENSIDGYHAIPTHYRYFVQYLHDLGADSAQWTGPRRRIVHFANATGMACVRTIPTKKIDGLSHSEPTET